METEQVTANGLVSATHLNVEDYTMPRLAALCTIGMTIVLGFAAHKNNAPTAVKRLSEAATVFSEIMAAPDKGIPQDLLNKAHCIVIVPGMKKGAFMVGGQYGKGFLACRSESESGWSAPAAIRMEGGSIGFQIGGSETDVILLVMNSRGADRLMSSQFTLGGEGTVAVGPVGRSATAKTDAKMSAEILSWSRSRGIFAGLAVEGATLREDSDDNAAVYGKRLSNRDIVTNGVAPPQAAAALLHLLNKYSPPQDES